MNEQQAPWFATYQSLGVGELDLRALPDLTISDYVREHARSFGEREALVFLGKGIRYAELDQLADRFAFALSALGMQPGDVLGIHLFNVPQAVVALVGAARLGVVVTLIAPLTSAQECITQANDARIKLLLTLDESLNELIPALAAHVPTLESVLISKATELLPDEPKAAAHAPAERLQVHGLWAALSGAQPAPLPNRVPSNAVLYVMYTGGTTGLPKGARLSSRNLLVTKAQVEAFFRFREGAETVASAFPIYHIGGMTVLLNALSTGSTFVLIPNPRDVEHLCDEMEKRPATIIAAVPTLLQLLVTRPSFSELDFSNLRVVISGAAPLAESEVHKLEVVIGKGKVCDIYGMTESCGVQTVNPPNRFKYGTVGVPVPGTDVRIVDRHSHQEVDIGKPGEILVSGPQVMHGYVRNDGETRRVLETLDGRTYVHTGDIGAFDNEGYLKIFDRSKDMLIVGGYKVFSVEVENQLHELPFIQSCAIVGRADLARPGNDVVLLYVQRVAGDSVPTAEREQQILAFCRAQLAPYKVPKEIHFVDAMPLTPLGKVDKRALRGTSSVRPGFPTKL